MSVVRRRVSALPRYLDVTPLQSNLCYICGILVKINPILFEHAILQSPVPLLLIFLDNHLSNV